jgi:hypothetical protein
MNMRALTSEGSMPVMELDVSCNTESAVFEDVLVLAH